MNALIVEDCDNVVVATVPITAGEQVGYARHDGTAASFIAVDDIPVYHKVAAADIKQGDPVIKYGETICLAAIDIKRGMHVHTHDTADLN